VPRSMILTRRTAVLAGAALAVVMAAPPGAALAAPNPTRLAERLVKAVNVNNVNRHLIALQRLATLNSGIRAASTPGHVASAQYVADKLTAAGYVVQLQEFQFPFRQTLAQTAVEVSPTPRTLTPAVMRFSPNTPVGGITAPLSTLPNVADATPGCEAADFASGTYAGTIVLIQRGGCFFQVKHDNAVAAGAVAVLVFNNVADPNEPIAGTLNDATSGVIPIAGLPRGQGETLTADAAAGPVTVRVELRVLSEIRTTHNVIAQTQTGRADNVVMVGSHLDSVTEGPGINDNGSGSATLLELAIQLAEHPVRNKVRFAWWSAEEFGLLGAAHYVSQLSFEQQLDIAMYLNFDMIGSTNFARFVFDGDNSDGVGAGPGPVGSAPIENVFQGFFDGRGLTHEGTDFDGRSDYGPFIAVAIPAGGLFTGAEGRKTAEQAARYGGTVGAQFDPCYHQACDTLLNVNRTVLDQNADAVAWAVGLFAIDTSAVNGNGSVASRQLRGQAARAKARASNSLGTGASHPVSG
jgi:Zn-dependent M28 family amino/carboxypeptidase